MINETANPLEYIFESFNFPSASLEGQRCNFVPGDARIFGELDIDYIARLKEKYKRKDQ